MNTKLFEISTIVEVLPRGNSVCIIATKEKRSAIWKLVVNNDLNPGVARYGYREDAPTTITLTPYPGYDGRLVANMAYAFACITEAGDWTHLFSVPASDFGEKNVKTEGFKPDNDVVLEIQRLFVNGKAVNVLNSMVWDLKFKGPDTNVAYDWNHEAIECLRRAGGTSTAPANIVADVRMVNGYAKLARATDKVKQASRKIIEEKVTLFKQTTAMVSPTELAQKYFEIVAMIDDETTRLEAEVDSLSAGRDMISELMERIRKATPPAPSTQK